MKLDEAIIQAEVFAEEYQSVADDLALDIFYCDNEVIKEHSANYQRRAEEQRQLAKWLRDYKRLLELSDKLDEIITKQIDISNNQVECQTLRWVLDVMSEMI